ncbi:MAG: hypothetical protein DMF92_18130 [Acidobacteria bacterium]|nr:MAG: hypothetical protein DMF92_18130 [Acidobacteriota bacterium]
MVPFTNFYELLGVAPAASQEEVKQAFRQQIARYHPDKVQHLGKEFQEMALGRAAELTQAYGVLSDKSQRAEYDHALANATSTPTPETPAMEPQAVAHRRLGRRRHSMKGRKGPNSFKNDSAATSS